jgi:2-polyprenyl-3-methyl-5-hydroxy-6-metoxy-1,4-benzoquinol methylase
MKKMPEIKSFSKVLEFKRNKKRWIAGSILYKINKIINIVLGKEKALKIILDLNLIIWRLTYENAYKFYGENFKNISYGINEELIKKYANKNSKIIDIGCGYGRLTKISASIAKRVVGIDYSLKSIMIAKKYNNNNNIEYICGDLNDLNENEKFDIAIMSGVLEHIDNAGDYLVKLHSIASKIIIEVPDIEADPLNIIRYNLNTRYYSDNDHVREYTFEGLSTQLLSAGWEIIYASKKGLQITIVSEKKDK